MMPAGGRRLQAGAGAGRGHDALISETTAIANPREAIVRIGKFLANSDVPPPSAIGHRIVHGGPKLRRHCLIDDSVLQELAAADVFAPLHMPAGLSVIRFAQELFPGLPQAACFDTVFHAGLRMSRACFRSPRPCSRKAFSVTGSTAFRTNR